MSELLALLREEAVTLVEAELPTTEELRAVVGALVKALGRTLGDEVEKLRNPVEPVSPVTAGVPVTGAAPVASVADQPTPPAPVADVPVDPVAAAADTVESEPQDAPLTDEEQALLAALQARQSAAQDVPANGEGQV